MRSNAVASHFWKWFERNHETYLNFFNTRTKKEMKYLIDDLEVHIRAYCRWLGADLSADKDKMKGELVITASGRQRGFDKADKLVAVAPKMPNWTFYALRPANPIGSFVEPAVKTIDAELGNMWFWHTRNGERSKAYIRVYVDYILPDQEKEVYNYVWLMIENLLGERSATLDIKLIGIHQRCDAPSKAVLHKLKELPEYIGGMRSTISIGAGGQMIW